MSAIAQEKTFFHEGTDRNARQFEAYLIAQWPSSGDTAKGFKTKGQAALKANDMRRATGSFASAVVLDKPIKTLGVHEVKIRLHPEVTVTVTLNIARSQDEAERQARGENVPQAYLDHPVLGQRLRECCRTVLGIEKPRVTGFA